MARTPLTTVKSPNRTTGLAMPAVAYTDEVSGDAVNDHSFANDGRIAFIARNSSASTPRTVEVEFQRAVDGVLPAVRSWTLAITSATLLGPWPVDDYGSVVNLNVDHADVKFLLLRI